MATDDFPYSFRINAARVVDKDEAIAVEPGAADLAALSRSYDLQSLDALKADLVLKPYRKAGLRVTGKIRAALTQICVVSLEPFGSDIEIDVDRTFEPYSEKSRKIRDLNEDGEIEIDLETLDPPDVIKDGVLDLGAMICEEMALALDPFPRKPGVEFEGAEGDDDAAADGGEDKPSPFAALQVLKDKRES